MARVRLSRQNFITGKLSLEAQANTEADVYNFGLDMCENFALKPLGGAFKRSGTELLSILKDSISNRVLQNYKFIRFFEYYYKGEKILIFITSGDEKNRSIFGYLKEDNTYLTAYISEKVKIRNDEFLEGEIFIEFEEYLNEISCWSSNNDFLFIIPRCHLKDYSVDKKGIDYSCFLKFNFTEGIVDHYWESEPLFPMENGDQLLLCCFTQQLFYESIKDNGPYWVWNIPNQGGQVYPWNGDLTTLHIYAQVLDKDGNRYNKASADDNGIRTNTYDLSKYDGLNVLFKITKTQQYQSGANTDNGADRTDDNADKTPPGVYWIGGKITVIKTGLELTGKNDYYWLGHQHINQDIIITLKESDQHILFPIVTLKTKDDNGDKLLVPPIDNVSRNKQIESSDWFITAFSRNNFDNSHLPGYLKDWPRNVISYKGRTYIFFKSWIWGSALGKSSTNFAMGEDVDLGFCVGWGDGKVGEVSWVYPASKMIIGTSSGIFYADSIIQVGSNNSISYQLPEMLTNIAPNKTFPTLIGQSIIFIGSNNRTVYEIQLAGENGISVSKINSHCLGMFTQDIVKIFSDNDYLYTIGEDGECNVCCFAVSGFTRRWFSYNFGGVSARFADAFVFNSGKIIGSFRRRLAKFPDSEVATIEHMRPLFDVYKDKSSEQFFLDCATAKYAKVPIEKLENAPRIEYIFNNINEDVWTPFFEFINDVISVNVLFYFYYYNSFTKNEKFSYFGGKDINCCIFVDSNDLFKMEVNHPLGGFKMAPFIYENEAAFEDVSLMGQPIFSDSPGTYDAYKTIIPFFDLEIFDYEFYYDEHNTQYLKTNLNKKVSIATQYLGVIFGLEKFNNNRPFCMTIYSDVDGYVFTITKIDEGANFAPFNYKNSYKDGVPNREFHRLYLSPYGSDALSNLLYIPFSFIDENIKISTLTFGKVGDSPEYYTNNGPSKVVINDVFGAKGYNENIYTLVSSSNVSSHIQSIYWKRKNIKYEDIFEIPEELYGGLYGNWGIPSNEDKEWYFAQVDIAAYCAANGQYSLYPKPGNVYFFMSYFKKSEIEYLIGETCQLTYDGNQGWLELKGDHVTNFVFDDDSFSPLSENDGTLVLHLPYQCIGIYIAIGLPYVSELQTVGLEGGSLFGTSEGTIGISREAALSVLFSRGGLYGNTAQESRNELYPLRYDAEILEGEVGFPLPVSRDQVSASFNTTLLADKNNMVRSMYILHDIPCNFAVLNIVQDVKVSDG